MTIANVIVLVVIAACVAWQFLRSTFIQAFATIIATICSIIVAFAYFEFAAIQLNRFPSLIPWAQALAFALLFIIPFAILLTLIEYLSKKPVSIAALPDQVGRIICGIVLGIIIAGVLLTILVMAPLPNQYPYPRFDTTATNADQPQKPLLNVDGFATGWFNIASKGSLRSKASFAALHPDYLNQVFLNRLILNPDLKTTAAADAIEVPGGKNVGAWRASDQLQNTDGKSLSPKQGHYLVIVRMGIKRNAFPWVGYFTPSQIRLICTESSNTDQPLTGSAINAWPIGYIKEKNKLQLKKLADEINVRTSDFKDKQAKVRYIDFAFNVPNDYVPVLLQFKQSSLVEVQKPVNPDQAPPAVPFGQDK